MAVMIGPDDPPLASRPPVCMLGSVQTAPRPVLSPPEVSEYLVGSPAFKAGGTGDPRPAGSIPVHLRHASARGGTSR